MQYVVDCQGFPHVKNYGSALGGGEGVWQILIVADTGAPCIEMGGMKDNFILLIGIKLLNLYVMYVVCLGGIILLRCGPIYLNTFLNPILAKKPQKWPYLMIDETQITWYYPVLGQILA